MSLLKIIINGLTIIAMLVIFQSIMIFLNIGIRSFVLYLIWFITIIIFYYILPSNYYFFKN
jgi:hypothetical protein